MSRNAAKRVTNEPGPRNGVFNNRFECRVSHEQKAKLEKLGGAEWFRKRIDLARVPEAA